MDLELTSKNLLPERMVLIMAGKTTKIGRDAKSGKLIPVKTAIKRPSTTVVETIKRGK